MTPTPGGLSLSRILRGVRSFLLIVVVALASIYAVYFFGVALFLNSGLFAKAAGMEDEELTQILFANSWSPYPGVLNAGSITVAVRDGNVTSKISLSNATIHFEPRDLLRKKAHILSIHVGKTDAFFHMKTDEEKTNFHAKYSKPTDTLATTDEEIELRKKERWKIIVDRVELPKLESLRFDQDVLTGDLSILGKFTLQPGTEAEIGPATLTIHHGKWNDDLEEVELVANANFHPFSVPRTAGSEVFKYLDADVTGAARAKTLRVLNITLRSLGDYGFGSGAASLKGKFLVKAGTMQPGTFVETDRNAINFESPRIKIHGKGQISWKTSDRGDFSVLTVKATAAKANVQISERMKIEGSVDQVDGIAELAGLYLPNAFSGLKASMKIQNALLDCETKSEEPWRVKAKIEGEVQVLSGEWKGKKQPTPPSNFQIDILESSVKLQEFGKLEGRGRIKLSLDPIDFRGGRSDFPSVDLVYAVRLQDQYKFLIHATNHDLYRVFGSNRKDADLWNGTTNIELSGFDEVLRYLHDTDRLSGLVKSLISSKTLRGTVEWQAASDSLWLRAKDLKTDGPLSVFGTYTESDEHAATGVFEGKVIGIPVGIGLLGSDVKVRILPKRKWYDELKKPEAKR